MREAQKECHTSFSHDQPSVRATESKRKVARFFLAVQLYNRKSEVIPRSGNYRTWPENFSKDNRATVNFRASL